MCLAWRSEAATTYDGGPIPEQNSIAHRPNYIYSSKTASHVNISAEQHCEYIFQPNSIARIFSGRTASYVRIRTLGVASAGSGDLWEWRPVTAQRHRSKAINLIAPTYSGVRLQYASGLVKT